MFRAMRRSRQELSREETEAVLARGTHGVLAVAGDEGYPYAVPLSYTYRAGKLYFHCAKAGHKLDAIRGCDKVSFCVVDQDEVVGEKFTTYFRSAIAFGRVREVTDPTEIWAVMEHMSRRYGPDETQESIHAEISREEKALCVLEMEVEHLTGKEAIELVRGKEAGG